MLFDLKPKDERKDLFGRDRELRELEKLTESEWVAIVGARMTGKTSLVKTFLTEKSRRGKTAIYVNLLGARGIRDFVARVSESVVSAASTREISLKLPFVEVTQTFRFVENLFSQLQAAKRDVLIALDEVQELCRVSRQFLKLLKLIHDTYSNVTFIFTGSMFGLMRLLLEPEASSPMYGRKPAKLELTPFSEQISMNFLREGFRELKVQVEEEELREVVGILNGYVGWLTYYGNFRCIRGMGREVALKEVLAEGKKVVKEELENFLKDRDKQAYLTALKTIALGARWSDVKRALEGRFGEFNNKRVSDILGALTLSMLVEKRGEVYVIPDPVLRKTVLESAFSPEMET
jgi:AAA+ ATPase superfamily predicted ATPase